MVGEASLSLSHFHRLVLNSLLVTYSGVHDLPTIITACGGRWRSLEEQEIERRVWKERE